MKLDTQINFRTSSEIKEELEKIAKSKGLRPSQLLNEIVEDFVKRKENQVTEKINLEKVYEMLSVQGQRLELLEKQQQEMAKKSAA
ncbi:ribbon-helix-helix domain-containing protein [Nostoc sphaeroides CHAB 2801]|uniref:ribbon-helix-helix domain-containing protein n=1 Tax=Nostoc sphaeroides TaxID=446679 RepID=UPI001E4A7A70|nr:ribbon-helix-helix domain-containing protein [Nostoc sphaeroides]MCC5632684.1 ribbon-helix-helix domain-containing protein [Nostoc sphaeroides CHAB 2801]